MDAAPPEHPLLEKEDGSDLGDVLILLAIVAGAVLLVLLLLGAFELVQRLMQSAH